jgi:hypothetical protein
MVRSLAARARAFLAPPPLTLPHFPAYSSPQSSPMEYNGSAVVAMTGKNCVAIAR